MYTYIYIYILMILATTYGFCVQGFGKGGIGVFECVRARVERVGEGAYYPRHQRGISAEKIGETLP